MSITEEAYKAAQDLIAKAIEDGETTLSFRSERYHWLETIPPEILNIQNLKSVNLDNTKVRDITLLSKIELEALSLSNTLVDNLSPITKNTALRMLLINDTEVSDLSPLIGLTKLDWLDIGTTPVSDLSPLAQMIELETLIADHTQVADISPLSNLERLIVLNLDYTKVADLRPILYINFEYDGFDRKSLPQLAQLSFKNTPATVLDPELERLSEIPDSIERKDETLTYLRTLPPWPQPLRGEEEEAPPAPAPARPAPFYADYQDGQLTPVTKGDGLEPETHARAQQGWAALADYIEDFDEEQRSRMANSMPRMIRALDRVQQMLMQSYDAIDNPIRFGIQANRVIRLSTLARDMLMEEDAEDILNLAAELTLYMARYPVWTEYTLDAETDPPPAALQQIFPDLTDFTEHLRAEDTIDPAIPDVIDQMAVDAQETPDDPLVVKGLWSSLHNTLSPIAEMALKTGQLIRQEVRDVGKLTWKALKINAAGVLSATIIGAFDILLNKAALMTSLASHYPQTFGWLKPILLYLGLI